MTEESIFDQAIRAPTAERPALLDEACSGDPELRDRVERLLAADAASTGRVPLESGVFSMSPMGETPSRVADVEVEVGHVLGPYRLLQKLGEGGMGTVWAAEQTRPVRRRVALKLVKTGVDSARVVARFEAERQALALMDHTSIAKVFDAGKSDDGRPFFAMELVRGVPITKYCDEVHASVVERLRLFAEVCAAVQHAHTKGVVHRDLKPSNVLVAMQDGRAIPKIIDFGVAKALYQKLSEKTMDTEIGQVIGTLEYMAPEQAELSPLDVDTRADVFALGVLLYELLVGSTPITRERMKSAALVEVLRMIKEEEPPKPSTRLSHSKETWTALAAVRRTDPKKLQSALMGELDWIVLRALEKDRTRRYETAEAFKRDVERFLADEPVEARPQGAGYRLRKFVKRHRLAAGAAACAAVSLSAGVVGLAWGLAEANRARLAETTRAEGERQASLAAEARRVEAERERLRAEAGEKLAAERLAQVEAERRIAVEVRDFLRYRVLGQADVRLQADLLLRSGRTAADAKPNPTIREILDRTAKELTPEKAEQYFPKQPLLQAELLKTVGDVYRAIGEHATAIEFLTRAVDLWTANLGPEHPSTLAGLHNLALSMRNAGKRREAIELFERVRDANVRRLGAEHPQTLVTLNNLALTYREVGDKAAAVAILERARDGMTGLHGAEHPDTLTTLANLATAYQAAGRRGEAISLFERVKDVRTKVLGPEHPETLAGLSNLATAYRGAGRLSEAVRLFEQAKIGLEGKLGPEHPDTLATMNNLALAYQAAGAVDKALRLFEEASTLVEKLDFRPERGGRVVQHAIEAYESAKRFDKGEVWRRKRMAVVRRKSGGDSCELAGELAGLGWNLLRQEKWGDAERVLRECVAIRERAQPEFWGTFNAKSQLGGALLGQKRYAEAERLLLEGYAGLAARESSIPPQASTRLVEAVDRLVEFYLAIDKPDEAKKWKAKRAKRSPTLVAPARAGNALVARR